MDISLFILIAVGTLVLVLTVSTVVGVIFYKKANKSEEHKLHTQQAEAMVEEIMPELQNGWIEVRFLLSDSSDQVTLKLLDHEVTSLQVGQTGVVTYQDDRFLTFVEAS
ncbi:hypothetical protein FLK61_25095 [Paenalkalicoccus suaedae]|uniref:DUF2500 domain-containing protein n=1 Tax=Paenalkalicoccus suaedae TaxID=2592382 RepID=A0A859FA04_9BACI|nr:hypothetical protein [Paenalkalicoccus suaedae]QKS70053.1 hypothetical protein FLK61_25095 [Paenalkalicoccus suaedae]